MSETVFYFFIYYFYFLPLEADGVFEATSATDWWSYGAILFELLTAEVSRMLWVEESEENRKIFESTFSKIADNIQNIHALIKSPKRGWKKTCNVVIELFYNLDFFLRLCYATTIGTLLRYL